MWTFILFVGVCNGNANTNVSDNFHTENVQRDELLAMFTDICMKAVHFPVFLLQLNIMLRRKTLFK
jgi:hypothetical protein